jgi:hypothetical protein
MDKPTVNLAAASSRAKETVEGKGIPGEEHAGTEQLYYM